MKPRIALLALVTACVLNGAESTPNLAAQMQDAVVLHPNVAEVGRLLEQGFDPNTSIGCGDYPALLGAVERRDVAMTRLLLEHGAKVPDAAMLTACGTYDRDLTLVRLLVEHGGNVNAKRPEFSCMHRAAWHRNTDLVQYLAKQKGIDLNVVCRDGENDGTPLMLALQLGATDVADILLAAGTDVHVRGEKGATAATVIAERMHAYEHLRAAVDGAKPQSGAQAR